MRMAITRKAEKVLSRKITGVGQIGFDPDGNMVLSHANVRSEEDLEVE